MNKLDQFVIPFRGLATGKHLYEFEIDAAFFESFEHSEIHEGKVIMKLELEKKDRMLVLGFSFSGDVTVLCDRCLDPFSLPVKGDNSLFVKFGHERAEITDDMVMIQETDHEIDISQYIYEFINLSLSYKRVHPDDDTGNSGCNPAMLNVLNKRTKNIQNDSPWEALKNIKDNNNLIQS